MKPATPVLDWPDAYDVCRERDRPVRVLDRDGSITLIFPSGSSRPITGSAVRVNNVKYDLYILPPEPQGVTPWA